MHPGGRWVPKFMCICMSKMVFACNIQTRPHTQTALRPNAFLVQGPSRFTIYIYITMPMFILNSYRCILYLQSLILTYSPIRSITDEFDHLEVISAELLLFFYLTSASILQKLGPCLLCSLICVQSTLTSNDAYVHCHCTTV